MLVIGFILHHDKGKVSRLGNKAPVRPSLVAASHQFFWMHCAFRRGLGFER